MGAPDAAAKEFMSDAQNFADAYNQGLFRERVIDPKNLEQINPDLITAVFKDGGKRIEKEIERTLDDARIVRTAMRDNQATYLLLGMQYQRNIHYAMPVRNLLEAAQLYAMQVRRLAVSNRARAEKQGQAQEQRQEKGERLWRDSGEFLSGITREDRLYPVIVLVLYFGEEPWDGPRRLRDMLTTADQRILRYTCDYQLNLVTPEDIPDLAEYHDSQFWKLMRAIAASHRGKEALMRLSEQKEFETMRNDTIRLMNTLLETNIKLNQTEGGYVNMCKAMREINEEIAGYQGEIAVYRGEIKKLALENAQLKAKLSMTQSHSNDTDAP